jgi:hypothetical protein
LVPTASLPNLMIFHLIAALRPYWKKLSNAKFELYLPAKSGPLIFCDNNEYKNYGIETPPTCGFPFFLLTGSLLTYNQWFGTFAFRKLA